MERDAINTQRFPQEKIAGNRGETAKTQEKQGFTRRSRAAMPSGAGN
jgi:hypothetical protein